LVVAAPPAPDVVPVVSLPPAPEPAVFLTHPAKTKSRAAAAKSDAVRVGMGTSGVLRCVEGRGSSKRGESARSGPRDDCAFGARYSGCREAPDAAPAALFGRVWRARRDPRGAGG